MYVIIDLMLFIMFRSSPYPGVSCTCKEVSLACACLLLNDSQTLSVQTQLGSWLQQQNLRQYFVPDSSEMAVVNLPATLQVAPGHNMQCGCERSLLCTW